jgi:hypothetical protein
MTGTGTFPFGECSRFSFVCRIDIWAQWEYNVVVTIQDGGKSAIQTSVKLACKMACIADFTSEESPMLLA